MARFFSYIVFNSLKSQACILQYQFQGCENIKCFTKVRFFEENQLACNFRTASQGREFTLNQKKGAFL